MSSREAHPAAIGWVLVAIAIAGLIGGVVMSLSGGREQNAVDRASRQLAKRRPVAQPQEDVAGLDDGQHVAGN